MKFHYGFGKCQANTTSHIVDSPVIYLEKTIKNSVFAILRDSYTVIFYLNENLFPVLRGLLHSEYYFSILPGKFKSIGKQVKNNLFQLVPVKIHLYGTGIQHKFILYILFGC